MQRLPLLAVLVQAFNGKGLVARTPGAGLGLQRHFTRHGLGHGDRRNRIDERVQMATTLHRRRWRDGGCQRCIGKHGLHRFSSRLSDRRLLGHRGNGGIRTLGRVALLSRLHSVGWHLLLGQSLLTQSFLMGFTGDSASQFCIRLGKATCGFGQLYGLGAGNGLAEITQHRLVLVFGQIGTMTHGVHAGLVTLRIRALFFRLGALGCIATRSPGVIGNDQRQQHHAQDGQTDLQVTHVRKRFFNNRDGKVQENSAMDKADSMSTATIRDTPCSCMVTPISCSAISMAILL